MRNSHGGKFLSNLHVYYYYYSYWSLLSGGRTLVCQGYSSREVRFSFGVIKLLIILAVPSKVVFCIVSNLIFGDIILV